jgi:hypothetical protein
MKTRTIVSVACLTIMCILAISISHLTAQNHKSARQESEARPVGTAVRLAERNPDRNAYYGETHVHTSWSFVQCTEYVLS